MKKLFFSYVWLNLTRIAELRKEDLMKHIRKRTIQTGRLFFSSSLTFVLRAKTKNNWQKIWGFIKLVSTVFSMKKNATLALAYRLKRHSGDLIPAIYWWKLAQKEIEQDIRNNPDAKLKEAKLVKNIVYRETA